MMYIWKTQFYNQDISHHTIKIFHFYEEKISKKFLKNFLFQI
jgi:hypothetical protein